jgi:hypothetical protein
MCSNSPVDHRRRNGEVTVAFARSAAPATTRVLFLHASERLDLANSETAPILRTGADRVSARVLSSRAGGRALPRHQRGVANTRFATAADEVRASRALNALLSLPQADASERRPSDPHARALSGAGGNVRLR